MTVNVPSVTKSDIILGIARACHEANKSWCEMHGDASQKHWDDAEEWQRSSAAAP